MFRRLCLFVIVVLSNFQIISYKYITDDKTILTLNTISQQGISGIPEILTLPRLAGFEGINDGTYRPIPLITHALEYQLFGFNPAISHFINITIYGLICILVFEILKFFIKDKLLLYGITFLFIFHPIHLEVISTIKGRDDLLGGFFAGIYILNVFKERNAKWNYFLLILGFLCKESLMLLAFLPLIYKKDLRTTLKSFACLSLFIIWHEYVILSFSNRQVVGSFIDNPLLNQGISTRILSNLDILNRYLTNLLITDYHLDYSFPIVNYVREFRWSLLSGMLIFILTLFTQYRKHSLALILFLLPSLNLFLIGAYYGDRLAFFSSIFFILLVGCLLQNRSKYLSYPLVTVLLITYSSIYYSNLGCWDSNLALAQCSQEKDEISWKEISNIGVVAMLEGNYQKCASFLSMADQVFPTEVNTKFLKECRSKL